MATLVGLVVSITLTMSIPIYADAVYFRLFQADVLNAQGDFQGPTAPASPSTFQFMYNGDAAGKREWENVQPINRFLESQPASILGMRQVDYGRYFSTETLRLIPSSVSDPSEYNDQITWINIASMLGIKDHITMLEGKLPSAADPTTGVLVSRSFADKSGIQTGEKYTLYKQYFDASQKLVTIQIPIVISGIWQPSDPNDPYWFVDLSTLNDELLVPEDVFGQKISPVMNGEIYLGLWRITMDEAGLRYSDASVLANRIQSLNGRAQQQLPNVDLITSPLASLEKFKGNETLLTIQLYAFSLPVLGLLLAFISLTAGLSIEQRQNEIAILRSRGGHQFQVLGMALLEGLILGLIALGISAWLGPLVAYLIGQTRSFMDFSMAIDFPAQLNIAALKFGLATVAIDLISILLPTLQASRNTIISYKQQRARLIRPPFWQRAGLDLFLFAPVAYGSYLLVGQGNILGSTSRDPFSNPLLFLLPAISIFSFTLLFLRVIPLLMRVLNWVMVRTHSVGLLMAIRHLARTPGYYVTPLVLLILTLSLSVFTASLANTLDQHLYDQAFYQVGAALKFKDYGEDTQNTLPGAAVTTKPTYLSFLPVTEYAKMPGVLDATRVGLYNAGLSTSDKVLKGTFMGIDQDAFPRVAYWRSDFASSYLVGLMNQLASTSDGVLLPSSVMAQAGLSIGDSVVIGVNPSNASVNIPFTVVGTFDLFPTWYPETGPLIVGNLDYLFDQAGQEYPYEVWLKLGPSATLSQIKANQPGKREQVKYVWDSAIALINAEQQRPDRQGLLGLLSVGFSAAALLTVIGFTLYSLFSFRWRLVEFGVLQAVGLSPWQMISFLAWELTFLIGLGSFIGTLLGIGASRFYIPYLQVGTGTAAHIPPYQVQISWQSILPVYALFGLLFILALVVLVLLLRRLKIFQAIKLGETI